MDLKVSRANKMRQKGFAPLVIIIIVALVAVVGAYYLGGLGKSAPKENQPTNQLSITAEPSTASPKSTPDLTANWGVFSDTQKRFIFKYPSNLNLSKSPSYDYIFYLETANYKPFTQGSYQIEIETQPNSNGIPKVAPSPQPNTPEGDFTDKIELTTINGFTCVITTYKGGWSNYKRYVFYSQNISVNFFGTGDNHTIIDQVASTFKFTQ